MAELAALGHDGDTVRLEQLTGRNDGDGWSATQTAGRFLITQDLDSSDLRRYAPGTHAGLLVVRLAQPGRQALARPSVSALCDGGGRDMARVPGHRN